MEKIKIRNEKNTDYEATEMIIKKAFWNLYVPGCSEHYLAHILRSHEDFVPELDLVIEADNKIIGNIMYTKSRLADETGNIKNILTFGPVCIAPEYQRRGYGKALMEYSFERAAGLGYEAIVIFGSPANYVARGFKSCKKFNVSVENGVFPTAMLVKELKIGALSGHKWTYSQSSAFEFDENTAQRYMDNDSRFIRKTLPAQEEFYILSNSVIR
ncbi:MAG: N-acetyltransferase [Clostridia bacterium]|nr:N-acetyltransferase [Clostridia bacterium]